jgi:ABC-type amino acid transport substrate-binding protein
LPRPLVHPAAESEGDLRGAYPLNVLRMALQKSGHGGRLAPYPVRATQERVLRLIESGELDVGWSMASADRERRLGMVPFPVDRGLLGWRLLLARRSELGRFSMVEQLSDLEGLRVAQGHDWPDRVILAENGLPTTAAVGYDSLFAMLDLRRVDYLARAGSEAERERKERPSLDLAVVPGLVLHYRTALVFYVRRDDPALRDALTSGLAAMLADGSLDRLFREAYGEDLALLASPPRRVIALRNPIAAAGLETAPDDAWWSP